MGLESGPFRQHEMLEIFEKPRSARLPAQPLPGLLVCGRGIQRYEMAEDAEMRGRLLGRDRDHRQVQALSERLGISLAVTPCSSTACHFEPASPFSRARR